MVHLSKIASECLICSLSVGPRPTATTPPGGSVPRRRVPEHASTVSTEGVTCRRSTAQTITGYTFEPMMAIPRVAFLAFRAPIRAEGSEPPHTSRRAEFTEVTVDRALERKAGSYALPVGCDAREVDLKWPGVSLRRWQLAKTAARLGNPTGEPSR